MSEEIAYCKIFPPIGIARVGNSRDYHGFFIGPEGSRRRDRVMNGASPTRLGRCCAKRRDFASMLSTPRMPWSAS